MIFLSILLNFSLSINAIADLKPSPVDTQKTLDGKTLYCAVASDTGKVGYQPNLPMILTKEELTLSFGVASVTCTFVENEGYRWALRLLNDPYPGEDLNGEPITTRILETEAIVIDSHHRVIGSAKLENKWLQIVQLPLALDKILSKAQTRSLEAGHEITVRLEYFNRTKYEIDRAGRTVLRGQLAGGSYFYTFTLLKNASGEIKASAISVN